MHSNLTKIASLPQGGGCKAVLVGEVQSRAAPEMSEATQRTFAKISDPANAQMFSAELAHKAFVGVPSEYGPELFRPGVIVWTAGGGSAS